MKVVQGTTLVTPNIYHLLKIISIISAEWFGEPLLQQLKGVGSWTTTAASQYFFNHTSPQLSQGSGSLNYCYNTSSVSFTGNYLIPLGRVVLWTTIMTPWRCWLSELLVLHLNSVIYHTFTQDSQYSGSPNHCFIPSWMWWFGEPLLKHLEVTRKCQCNSPEKWFGEPLV